jgi:hypothetical protein
MNFVNLTGQRFGRWFVLNSAGKRGKFYLYRCVCDCGNEKIVVCNDLRNGRSTSCGCFRKEQVSKRLKKHGMTNTPTYHIWVGMRQRCFNSKSKSFAGYGGRGITVCSRWIKKDGFRNFLTDLGEKPKGYSLHRIDNDGDYTPKNCIWASPKIQRSHWISKDVIRFLKSKNLYNEFIKYMKKQL